MPTIWRDQRWRNALGQIALVVVIVGLIAWMFGTTVSNLTSRGIKVGFAFLSRPARFPISESVLPYDPSDSFLWAYTVGLANTLAISTIVIVLSTMLGLFIGLARGSSHPLVAPLAGTYVTTIRNMPLIVQLLFWYAVATSLFPAPRQAISPLPGVFLTQRGIYVPQPVLGPYGSLALVAGIVVTGLGFTLSRRAAGSWFLGALAAAILAGIVAAAAIIGASGFTPSLDVPILRGFNFTGGTVLSPEFAALIIGLTLYTAAFIGEIIRGGIEAVGKERWEAARSVGLTEGQALSKVVIPQALRIIIPPLTSQYLSTVKNTTLALAVGYPELGLVVGTVINQTGQAIESIVIMLAVFLSISISVSLFMNWYNMRVALVTQ